MRKGCPLDGVALSSFSGVVSSWLVGVVVAARLAVVGVLRGPVGPLFLLCGVGRRRVFSVLWRLVVVPCRAMVCVVCFEGSGGAPFLFWGLCLRSLLREVLGVCLSRYLLDRLIAVIGGWWVPRALFAWVDRGWC